MRFLPSERDVHHWFDIPANPTILPSNLKSTTQSEAFPYKGVELLLDWIGTHIFPNHCPSLAVELFSSQLQCRRLSEATFLDLVGAGGRLFWYWRERLSHSSS